ncbi:MAG: hypothetical protein WAV41_05335 [Microgenomates group bacterium]
MTNSTNSTDLKGLLVQLDNFLTEYLVKKAPSLPDNVKEIIVKYAPYLSILVIVLAVPGVIALLGLSAMMTPFAYTAGLYRPSFSFPVLFLIASLVIEALAIPGLFARKITGWNFMLYGTLINAVYQLLRLDIGGLIISTGLSLYFLYQVKSLYKA